MAKKGVPAFVPHTTEITNNFKIQELEDSTRLTIDHNFVELNFVQAMKLRNTLSRWANAYRIRSGKHNSGVGA